jgi:transcription elongation factor Elf1
MKNKNPGIIWAPYIIVTVPEGTPRPEYDEFIKNYKFQHAACLKCGHTGCSTTLVGYILNMNKKEEYKNLNWCTCTNCGDKHRVHDRVPVNYYLDKN